MIDNCSDEFEDSIKKKKTSKRDYCSNKVASFSKILMPRVTITIFPAVNDEGKKSLWEYDSWMLI